MGLGWGGGGLPPRIFEIAIFGLKKNQDIFGQIHLIFMQAVGGGGDRPRDFSAPNETRPVYAYDPPLDIQ